MKTITIGKYRGLQQCSTPDRAIVIMALDHRNNLRHAINPTAPDSVTDSELTAFKHQVVGVLAPVSSAVLLDPQYGGGQCIATGALPGGVGLVMAVEASGYTGDITARKSEVLPGWSVAKVRRMGGNAIKLLAYYHPDTETAAEIESMVRQVARDCQVQDIPFFLEPLSYSPDSSQKKLSPQERRRVVLETARRLTPLGVDVLKAEFPVDIQAEPDEHVWTKACADLTAASQVPWVLLSAAADFDTYLRMVIVACQQGASGVAVGRAVWQEGPALSGQERQQFLENVAKPRMQKLMALCTTLAQPWTKLYEPTVIGPDWYIDY
jgi:tagatose 1,6-diphosphate aldolase